MIRAARSSFLRLPVLVATGLLTVVWASLLVTTPVAATTVISPGSSLTKNPPVCLSATIPGRFVLLAIKFQLAADPSNSTKLPTNEPPACLATDFLTRPVSVTTPPQQGPTTAPAPPTALANSTPPSTAADTSTLGSGCFPALVYLETHAAPGFRFICPGNALGQEAMTCDDFAPVCPGSKLIIISDPCPTAYMNEASNSWVVEGLSKAPIDPFGPGC